MCMFCRDVCLAGSLSTLPCVHWHVWSNTPPIPFDLVGRPVSGIHAAGVYALMLVLLLGLHATHSRPAAKQGAAVAFVTTHGGATHGGYACASRGAGHRAGLGLQVLHAKQSSLAQSQGRCWCLWCGGVRLLLNSRKLRCRVYPYLLVPCARCVYVPQSIVERPCRCCCSIAQETLGAAAGHRSVEQLVLWLLTA